MRQPQVVLATRFSCPPAQPRVTVRYAQRKQNDHRSFIKKAQILEPSKIFVHMILEPPVCHTFHFGDCWGKYHPVQQVDTLYVPSTPVQFVDLHLLSLVFFVSYISLLLFIYLQKNIFFCHGTGEFATGGGTRPRLSSNAESSGTTSWRLLYKKECV